MLPRRPFLGLVLHGDVVAAVWPESAVARAGIVVGDRIEAIDGEPFTGAMPQRSSGATIAITTSRTTHAVVLEPWPHESTPHATTDYDHVEVLGARLRTIVTAPESGFARAPGVVLLPGLVSASIEQAPEPDPAWHPIVVALAAAGIVSLRLERRGLGDSEGGPAEDVDFATELAGYVAAAQALRARADVDPDRVGLFGHSVGAMQAPLVAAEVPVRSIAVYGTTIARWSANMIPLARRQLLARGLHASDEAIATDSAIAAMIANDDAARIHVHGRSLAYLRQLDRTDIAAAWSRFAGDVLVLHGEHDVVTDARDHDSLAKVLRARDRGRVEQRTLPALGHTMLRVTDPRADLERPHDGQPTDLVAAALAGFLA